MEKAPANGRRISRVFENADIGQSITTCFAKVVARHPERLAIKGASREYTYAELNSRANAIAHAILKEGGSGKIGILAGQEAGIAAVLGTLKAGKTYVPLEPSYPTDRLAQILKDCEIETIIAAETYVTLAKNVSNGSCRIISLSKLDQISSASDVEVAGSPDDLAAIMYTSGSSGPPKGVMQTQRNILHRVMLATNAFDMCPEDRVTLLSSLTYSASLLELFGTLLNGAAVYTFNIAEEGLSRLVSCLSIEKLTIYHSVPTVWRQLTQNLPVAAELGSLRVVRLGGDTLTARDVELYRRRYPPTCTLFNSLSCNEAGLIRLYRVDSNAQFAEPIVPVGYEVDGKQIWIADHNGKEAGHDEVGEIVIRSEFLSPGYWKNPELTSSVFRPDPGTQSQRLYYSGDLGTLLADGCLLYKGRKDSRIKFHGIALETTHLEDALRAHPEVDEALALANEDESGERHLVAYIVPKAGAELTTSELRRFLTESLPAQMLSASFVFLHALPHTPGGKVDRRALPQPAGNRPQIETRFVAPRDKWEQDLASVCESILRIDRIGALDNLFDLGMDSLAAVRLVTRIEKDFNEQIPPATLLRSPTVAKLAGVLRQRAHSKSWSFVVPVQPEGSNLPFFWIHGDFSNAFLPEYLGPDQPLYALDHQSQDGKPALHTTVENIAAHYLEEIRTVQMNGPYFIGGYSFGAIVAFEIAHQIQKAGDTVELLALVDPPGFIGDAQTTATKRRRELRNRVAGFRNDLNRHQTTLGTLDSTKKLDYVLSRASARIRKVVDARTRGIRNAVKPMIWETYLRRGLRVPPWLRSEYILNVYDRARLNYVPKAYRGRAILFRTSYLARHFQTDWNRLIEGDLQWIDLGSVDHMKLRDEPYIHLWANPLKIALSGAQADAAAPWHKT
jgi:amino acid adenylation domain-containing protein